MPAHPDHELSAHLKSLYAEYRTRDIEAKKSFFSPSCIQICRSIPSYAARDRDTIVRYLQEAADSGNGLATSTDDAKTGYYTIRPLRDNEFEFATDDVVSPAGFNSVDEVKEKATKEGWAGMRVDLWSNKGIDADGRDQDLLVKVQYWWRQENGKWVQILHDILYVGPRDGTEGNEGETLQ